MKKTNIYTAIIALIMAVNLTACAGISGTGSDTAEQNTLTSAMAGDTVENGTTEVKAVVNEEGETVEIVTASYTGSTAGMLDTSDMFTERDLEQTADVSEAKYLQLADDDTLTITDGGVYVLSGTAKNCTVRVEADSEEKVQLVLDGV